jgi:Domain of unknown function (DUF4189)
MSDWERSNMRRLYVPLVSVMSVMIATLLIAAASGASAAEDQDDQNDQNHQNHQDQLGPSTGGIYGAMWVSPSLGDSYFASARDLSAAIEQAGSECERAATDCAPGVWVKNGYASFAMDVTGAWGTGWGKYASSANTAAVAACEANGGVACTVLETRKTTSYNSLGLAEGGILPAGAAGSGGGGSGTTTLTPTPTPTPTPPTPAACADGLDNDGDELIDLDDPGCENNPQDDDELV